MGLQQRATRAGVQLEILGLDLSSEAVRFAQESAEARKIPIEFAVHDAISDELPSGFDVVISSLFLHHLSEEHAVLLLGKMARATQQLVLVNDLSRSMRGLILASSVSHLASTSRVVHVDAVLSARAAFTPKEALAMARDAGLERATATQCWPCRFLLTWSRL